MMVLARGGPTCRHTQEAGNRGSSIKQSWKYKKTNKTNKQTNKQNQETKNDSLRTKTKAKCKSNEKQQPEHTSTGAQRSEQRRQSTGQKRRNVDKDGATQTTRARKTDKDRWRQRMKDQRTDKDLRRTKDYIHRHANKTIRNRWREEGKGQEREWTGKHGERKKTLRRNWKARVDTWGSTSFILKLLFQPS